MQVVQIDDLGAQAPQAVLAIAADGLGAAINHALDAVVELHARQPALAAQRDLRSMRFEHPAHQRFIGAKAVQRGGVDQRHTQVEGAQQKSLRLINRRRRAIGVAQIHAAQPDGRDRESTH